MPVKAPPLMSHYDANGGGWCLRSALNDLVFTLAKVLRIQIIHGFPPGG
jgi:hypothetical protein